LFPLSRPSAEGRPNAFPCETFEIGDRMRVKNEFVSGHVSASWLHSRKKSGSLSLNRRCTLFRTPPSTIFRRKTNLL
jgi:hypothetical protein